MIIILYKLLSSSFINLAEFIKQIYKNSNKKWITKKMDKKMDRNKMYVDELKYFLDCVNKNKIPMNSIIDAIEPQKISLAIKESAKKGQKIKLN